MTLPDWLSTALTSYRPAADPSAHRPIGRRIIQRGDIRRVESCLDFEDVLRFAPAPEQLDTRVPAVGTDPEDALRLALVLDCNDDSAEIVLVHPYVELATEADLVFTPDATGVPYSVVIQTRVRSAVWVDQMRGRESVGSITEEALTEFGRVAVADDPFAVSPRTRTPLAGPVDPRWEFKLREIDTLNQLAADRLYAVFNDGLKPQRDLDYLDKLQTRGGLKLNSWTEQFGSDHGRDRYLCLIPQFDDSLALAA